MYVAYRRGLLKPGYPMGLQSILREETVLMMVAKELAAEHMVTETSVVNALIAPHINHKAVNERIPFISRTLNFIWSRFEYSNRKYMTAKEALATSGRELAKVWHKAKASGILQTFKARAAAWFASLRNKQ